jgi:hypothetical protein
LNGTERNGWTSNPSCATLGGDAYVCVPQRPAGRPAASRSLLARSGRLHSLPPGTRASVARFRLPPPPRAAACAHQPPPASRRAGALRCPSAPQHRCIGISGPGCDENRVASGLTWCSSSPILSSLREARRNRPGTRLYLRKETIRFLRTGSIGR